MSKVFEALERLAMPDELHIKECKKAGIGLTEDYEVVEQALHRLESIDNSNPSEALEILETLANDGLLNKEIGTISYNQIWLKNQIEILQQALLKAQKLEKENELLKEIIRGAR